MATKYRVAVFENGFGRRIYRVEQWRWWWPFWVAMTEFNGHYSQIKEFSSDFDATRFIYACINGQEQWEKTRMRRRIG